MTQTGAEGWGDVGKILFFVSGSGCSSGRPQETCWCRYVVAQTRRALGEVIWADYRVPAGMVGCRGVAVFWVRQQRPSGVH